MNRLIFIILLVIPGISLAQFTGGANDGFGLAQYNGLLNGSTLEELYLSSTNDGFGNEEFSGLLNGSPLSQLYSGGSNDGSGVSGYNGLLSGVQISFIYQGGSDDGFGTSAYEGLLDGSSLTIIYQGGSDDGFGNATFNGLLNGSDLAAIYSGGTDDGYGVSTFNGLLSGSSLAMLYQAGSGDGFGSAEILLAPLPVELIYFNATAQGPIVNLEWATASEINNQSFTVEKSTGMSDIIEVGTISGKGNTSEHSKYMMVDRHPFTGTSLYRVKQTDFDGTSTYSPWVKVTVRSNEQDIKLFPNPSNGEWINLAMIGPSDDSKLEILIYSQKGILIYHEKIVVTGNQVKKFHFNQKLIPGFYLVKLVIGNTQQTKKLIVN